MDIPAPLRSDGPDRIAISSGGGCLVLFGLPFFAAGVFMLLGGLGIVPFQNADKPPFIAYAVILFMGIVFTAVGASLMFLRQTVTLDRARKSATDEKRFLGYSSIKEMRLPDYAVVTIRRVAGDSDSSDSFPVTLESKDGEKKLKIHSSTIFEKSNKVAACAADFLRLPCEDRTTGTVRVVEASSAEPAPEPAPERRDPAFTPPPQNPRSAIEDINGELKITLPSFPPALFGVVIWAVFALIVATSFNVGEFWWGALKNADLIKLGKPEKIENAADWFVLAFYGFLTFVVFVAPLFKLLSTKGGRLLTVTSEGLVFEKKKWAASDILAVDAVVRSQAPKPEPSAANPFAPTDSPLARSLKEGLAQKLKEGFFYANRIQIKTRREIVDIPTGVPGDETEYLRGLIQRRLAKAAKRALS